MTIRYISDAQGPRIGKIKNGALQRAWLYRDDLRPIVKLTPSGQVKSLFIYGSRPNVPDFMLQGGRRYRIISDHVGSPILVVDADSSQVIQRISYDVWGRVLSDSNPGFQPFGFAGGLYDPDTGLVRFGVRDYDASVGRWTDKDPARFAGGMNFYVYAGNNPVNFFDQDGREPITLTAIAASIAINALTGAVWDIAEQMVIDQRSFSCIDWGQVAQSALTDGLSGGLGKVRSVGRVARVATKGGADLLPVAIKRHTPDQQALKDLVKNQVRTKGHLSQDEAKIVKEWAHEVNYPDFQDHIGEKHWVGGDHLHVPGAGKKHIKVK